MSTRRTVPAPRAGVLHSLALPAFALVVSALWVLAVILLSGHAHAQSLNLDLGAPGQAGATTGWCS